MKSQGYRCWVHWILPGAVASLGLAQSLQPSLPEGTNFVLRASIEAGLVYRVEYSDDFSNWVSAGTVVSGEAVVGLEITDHKGVSCLPDCSTD